MKYLILLGLLFQLPPPNTAEKITRLFERHQTEIVILKGEESEMGLHLEDPDLGFFERHLLGGTLSFYYYSSRPEHNLLTVRLDVDRYNRTTRWYTLSANQRARLQTIYLRKRRAFDQQRIKREKAFNQTLDKL